MITLFDVAKDDASVDYLARIFGNMYGIITSDDKYGQLTLVSTMFRSFNGVILTIGALLVVYITITGVMITAHEGEFMGKKYHQLWTPLRTVLGIAALVPTPAGYSAIQLFMMWFIVQGIGAADSLWQTTLTYIDKMGSPYAQIAVPISGTKYQLWNMFQAVVCDVSARQTFTGDFLSRAPYFCADPTNASICSASPFVPYNGNAVYDFGPTVSTGSESPTGLCGQLTVPPNNVTCKDPNSLACKVNQTQQQSLITILPIMREIATDLVKTDYSYRDFYSNSHNTPKPSDNSWNFIYDFCQANGIQNCCIPSMNPLFNTQCPTGPLNSLFYGVYDGTNVGSATDNAVTKLYWPYGIKPKLTRAVDSQVVKDDFMETFVNYFTSQINQTVTDYTTQLNQNQSKLSGDLEDAKNSGWMYAGSYYYVVSEMNNKMMDLPEIKVAPPSDEDANTMKSYRNNKDASLTLANIAAGIQPAQKGSAAQTEKVTGDASKDVANAMSVLGTSTSNPITQMQNIGASLLGIVVIAYGVMLGLAFSIALPGAVSPFVFGNGITNPTTPAFIAVSFFVVPAFVAFLGVLTVVGGTLSIYVPLIPYIIFTFGAIGWLISVVEAMVAGPLVALGILSPSGHHEILGKAEPALMLLFSIFLRPSLMVFGLMAAMFIASGVAEFVTKTFWSKRVFVSLATGPLQLIFLLTVYVTIITTAMNKCFSVIHLLPERVLTWIGGQAAGMGEGEAVSEMKGGVSAASGGAKATVSGTHGAGKGGAARAAKMGKDKPHDVTPTDSSSA